MPAQPSYAVNVANLIPSAAYTATKTGGQVTTGVATKPILGGTQAFAREAMVFLNVSAFTSGTLDLTIQGSVDNGTTWITLIPSSAWNQVTGTGTQVRLYHGPLPPLIRAVGTAGGGPSFTYTVDAVMGG